MNLRINALALPLIAGAALMFASTDAQAQLLNGNFASNTGSGQLTVGGTALANWTGGGKEGYFGSPTTPPVFVYALGTTTQLSSTGVNGDGFMGNVKFYGITTTPGGVVIAADGDPDWAGSISQSLSGLTVGNDYTLTFNWAGAQQQGFSGNTTERWEVSFGSETQSTATINTPSQTFVGWQTASMTFTPTSATQTLKFLAKGTPSGQPPWLLLNNVSMSSVSAVPEAGTVALLLVPGLIGAAYLRRRRK